MLKRTIRNLWSSMGRLSRPREDIPAPARGPAYAPSAWFCAGWQLFAADNRSGLEQMVETSRVESRDPAERTCLQAGISLLSGEARVAAVIATQALDARADFPAPYAIRARALRAQGQHRAALADFYRAAELGLDEIQIMLDQAQEHYALHELADARDCYQLALARAPDHAAALLGLARTLRDSGEVRAAFVQIGHAVQVSPLDVDIQLESALLHGRCDDLPGAVAAYERGIELAPDNVAACANLGLLYLSRLGDPISAQRYFERAIALDPSSVQAQANLGLALEEQGSVDSALAHYERLIVAHPAENEFRWNRGLALLANGDFRRGWADYEMRNALGRGRPPREFPYPVWTGEKLPEGAALLVYAEQGVGDEIMFASCVADVLARRVNCVIECDSRLAGIFARSFPAATVHGAARDGDRRWLAGYPQIKAQCAIASLPRLLRQSLSEFPSQAGYLMADSRRVADWQKRLERNGRGPNIGVAWMGGTTGTRRDLRSISLDEFASCLVTPLATFVNLQHDAKNTLAQVARTHGTQALSFAEELDDVDELAALCRALDHVVTVDNSIAHLAGALGCKTAILLSHSADWRWLRSRTTSPWYPSVTLCRQAAPGDWASAIAQVRAALNAGA